MNMYIYIWSPPPEPTKAATFCTFLQLGSHPLNLVNTLSTCLLFKLSVHHLKP